MIVVVKFLVKKNSNNALNGQVTIGTLIFQALVVFLASNHPHFSQIHGSDLYSSYELVSLLPFFLSLSLQALMRLELHICISFNMVIRAMLPESDGATVISIN
uniref:Uncharacterized protein n=1 Tax=Lactuca sativa TaxID=4236 RepID=A0A9R1XSN1_LACSA|nr:hypothetical protein LSAT_V11C300116790 [Lactuca sativa]